MYMSAADAFFVDSNLLLYSVDPVDSAKQERALVLLGHKKNILM